ncbi:MAG TPA: molybdate ABC transporter substrate-binding protein [Pirellulales bacterium]|jgi:molybdate transport system substrate-binding protein|nr:molybdate ABC transporter substrate-binding protein [Pirellulales bacterium]
MSKTRFLLAITALAWALIGSLGHAMAAEQAELSGKLLVLAAASTTEAVEQVRAEFVRLHPKVTIRASFAASSTLAQQIRAGAEADLFLSASSEWAEFLAKERLVNEQRDLLGNQLVVVVPADSTIRINELGDLVQPKIRHLALADPKSVPAGIYASQALEKLGLWKPLESRIAGAADVRQALHFVKTGAAEVGIVYATDAAASKAVRIAIRIEPKLSEPIRYPLILLEHGATNPVAVAFYEFLNSPSAGAIFRRHGFLVPTSAENARP